MEEVRRWEDNKIVSENSIEDLDLGNKDIEEKKVESNISSKVTKNTDFLKSFHSPEKREFIDIVHEEKERKKGC